MRYVKWGLLLLVLLIVVAGLVPFLVPADRIKDEVLSQIRASTGRTITIEHVSFSLFPTLGLNATGVKVANPDWAGGGDMAAIDTLDIGLELMPLLHKEVRLKELTLKKPVITLIRANGRQNWDFGNASAPSAQPAHVAASAAPGKAKEPLLSRLHLYRISISDGTLSYKDGAGKPQTVSGLDLTLKAPNLLEALELRAKATYEGKKADIELTLEKPFAYEAGEPTGANVKASFGDYDFTWKGTAALKNNVPNLTGAIAIPSLDFSKPEGRPATSQPAHAAGAPAAAPSGASRWSDAPIRLGALNQVDADVSLSIGSLSLPKTTLKDISAKLRLHEGRLVVDIAPIKAYGGTIQATIEAGSSNNFGLTAAASGVEGEPLLHDFASFDRVSGQLDLHLKLTGAGGSERAIVSSLGGNGDVHFKNGKLKGVNLASIVRRVTGGGGGGEGTDFSELSGTFTVSRGVISNNDLKMLSPLLRVTGEGTADLPNWQEHYLLKPTLVGSLEGQGGKDLSGITVPVHVEGPLDHPSYRPDLGSLVQDALKDPKKLEQNVRGIRDSLTKGGNLQKGLQNLLR